MQNLEQKRAAHALDWAPTIQRGAGDGKASGVVKKIPAQVMSSGLLSSMAFALSKEGAAGFADVYLAFIHYYDAIESSTLKGALNELCMVSAGELRQATAEFMAYISYLRRFV